MKIKPVQLETLAEQQFVKKIAQLIENEMPSGEKMPRPLLGKMSRHSIRVARGYGLTTERDIGTFVLHMLTVNPNFHLQQRIHAILMNKALPGAERLERILSDASDADWEQAGAMTNAAEYWQFVFSGPDDGSATPPSHLH